MSETLSDERCDEASVTESAHPMWEAADPGGHGQAKPPTLEDTVDGHRRRRAAACDPSADGWALGQKMTKTN